MRWIRVSRERCRFVGVDSASAGRRVRSVPSHVVASRRGRAGAVTGDTLIADAPAPTTAPVSFRVGSNHAASIVKLDALAASAAAAAR
jgi:hypothetical protein